MVGESPALLRIQTQLTRHLDMQVTQVKPPLGFRPDVEAGFRLLHDIPFFGQPAVRSSHLGQSPLSTVGETGRVDRATMVPIRLFLPWYA